VKTKKREEDRLTREGEKKRRNLGEKRKKERGISVFYRRERGKKKSKNKKD